MFRESATIWYSFFLVLSHRLTVRPHAAGDYPFHEFKIAYNSDADAVDIRTSQLTEKIKSSTSLQLSGHYMYRQFNTQKL